MYVWNSVWIIQSHLYEYYKINNTEFESPSSSISTHRLDSIPKFYWISWLPLRCMLWLTNQRSVDVNHALEQAQQSCQQIYTCLNVRLNQ